jgi:signal peptide peptidase-like protein 2B
LQLEVEVQLSAEVAQPLQSFYGYPGPFGAFSLGLLNDTATPPVPLALAAPLNACGAVAPPLAAGAAVVVARGNCSFAEKAWALQKAGWGAMLLFNNEEGAPTAARWVAAVVGWWTAGRRLMLHFACSRPLHPRTCLLSSLPCSLATALIAECVFMSAPRNETKGLTLAVVSLTAESGAALQALLAEHASPGQLAVTLRIPKQGPVDWSSIALWLIATSTVVTGSLWAGHGHWAGLSREGSTPSEKKGPEQPSVTIGMHGAVGFVVAASAMLLLLFFFLSKWLAYLLVRGACALLHAVVTRPPVSFRWLLHVLWFHAPST